MDVDITHIDIMLGHINNIIYNAYLHGADTGGGYNCNEEELIKSMNRFLKWSGYHKKYCVVINLSYINQDIPQFVRKTWE